MLLIKGFRYSVRCPLTLALSPEIDLRANFAQYVFYTEAEFTHILSTFPLVSEEVKNAALIEFKNMN
jgi:hypothetical protein